MMKAQDLQRGTFVYDRWWPEWGTGEVIQRHKTIALIKFFDRQLKYDRAHFQFLEKARVR